MRQGALPFLIIGGVLLALAAAGGALAVFSGSYFPVGWLSSGADYTPFLSALEAQYGLPSGLLSAIAYQESNFNPDAVNPSSGATGMFQLEPQFYPDAGASWQADAVSAAQALAQYYRQFGDWSMAIAAYDWGPSNVSRYLSAGGASSGQALPTETTNYIARVTQATGLTGSLVNV